MIISIVAVDKHFGIGKNNSLLFKLPNDMKMFRESTKNHVVAMGKKTLLSLPGGKPLKNRTNIVLTHHMVMEEGVISTPSLEEFIVLLQNLSEKETVFVIGGASIYKETLPYVDEVWMRKVDADGQADVFFPNIDESKDFEIILEEGWMIDNGYRTKLVKYKNINKK